MLLALTWYSNEVINREIKSLSLKKIARKLISIKFWGKTLPALLVKLCALRGYKYEHSRINHFSIQLAFKISSHADIALDKLALAPTRKEFEGNYTFVVFPF